jgi:hypothetical protein
MRDINSQMITTIISVLPWPELDSTTCQKSCTLSVTMAWIDKLGNTRHRDTPISLKNPRFALEGPELGLKGNLCEDSSY